MQLLQEIQHNKEPKIQKFNMLKDEVFYSSLYQLSPFLPKIPWQW